MPARHWEDPPRIYGGRAAPPPEFQDETVFDWIRRQNRPVKPAQPHNKSFQAKPAKEPEPTAFQAAVIELAKKKGPRANETPTEPNEGN